MQKYFIYAGRVTIDKGIDYLIEEWKTLGLNDYKLKIIGEGPLKKNLYSDNNVEILNQFLMMDIKLINNSAAVINPTRLYEGQPTLLCETSMQKKFLFPKLRWNK